MLLPSLFTIRTDNYSSGHVTVRIETGSYVNSATTFPVPENSINDEEQSHDVL